MSTAINGNCMILDKMKPLAGCLSKTASFPCLPCGDGYPCFLPEVGGGGGGGPVQAMGQY